MHSIVFATNNAHKLAELRQIAAGRLRILGLADIGCDDDIAEDADTLAGNAEAKARWVKEHYGYDCFADDTGLSVNALGGAPGVHTARYAGPGHDADANTRKLLDELADADDRRAHFTTVIALMRDCDGLHTFTGRVDGTITRAPQGDHGFGYDPVFMPDGWNCTFAEAGEQAKNAVSHRGRAVSQLFDFLFKD